MSTDLAPAPLELAEVLDPAWLSRALDGRFPGVQVAATTITEQITTMATKVRFHVEYTAQCGAPDDLCVKGYFLEPGRANPSMGLKETLFYEQLAAQLPVRVPDCVYGGTDPVTKHSIIIMEDLVAKGCSFLSAMSPYTPDQVAGSLDQLASMHAATWGDERLISLPWLTPSLEMMLNHVTPERLQELLNGPRGEGLPRDVLDGSRLRAAIVKISGSKLAGATCLVHGDAHAGNLFQTADGHAGIVDWQILQMGSWGIDVAYHVGAVLDVADRERSEQDLLRSYLDRLRANGVEPPTWDEAWTNYRIALAYGLFLWGITIRVDPPIINAFVGRLGAAVAQHRSLDLLGV